MVGRDGWFSGIRWQVSLTWGLCWYEGLISHSGLAYEKYERPSASPSPSPTPSVYYKIITTRSRPGPCWKNAIAYANKAERTQTAKHFTTAAEKHAYVSQSASSKSVGYLNRNFSYPLIWMVEKFQRQHRRAHGAIRRSVFIHAERCIQNFSHAHSHGKNTYFYTVKPFSCHLQMNCVDYSEGCFDILFPG